jgi:hypothetical protein
MGWRSSLGGHQLGDTSVSHQQPTTEPNDRRLLLLTTLPPASPHHLPHSHAPAATRWTTHGHKPTTSNCCCSMPTVTTPSAAGRPERVEADQEGGNPMWHCHRVFPLWPLRRLMQKGDLQPHSLFA